MTEKKNRNLTLRIISAFVAIPIISYLIYLGGPPLAGLYSVAAAAVAFEYYKMTLGRITPPALAGVIGVAFPPLFPAMERLLFPNDVLRHSGDLAFWWIVGFFLFFFIWHLLRDASKDAPTHIAHLVTGMVYACSGTVALSFIAMRENAPWWTFSAMCITWTNDTAAYFVGRAIGKHKLYPSVSPNKTWEGFFGGMAGSIGALFIIRIWFHELTISDCLILGVLCGIMGPLGDLAESMLKRSYGVKDSGNTIPGHGGMMDRVDALLFNGFMVFVYLQLTRGFVEGR